MSHDRKPGRAQVMKPGAEPPQRRRGDGPPVVVDAASIARTRKAARRASVMTIALFLLATVGGAVATELYLPS